MQNFFSVVKKKAQVDTQSSVSLNANWSLRNGDNLSKLRRW